MGGVLRYLAHFSIGLFVFLLLFSEFFNLIFHRQGKTEHNQHPRGSLNFSCIYNPLPKNNYRIGFQHIVLPLFELCMNGIMQYLFFFFFLLTLTFVRFIHIIAYSFSLYFIVSYFIVSLYQNLFFYSVDRHLGRLQCLVIRCNAAMSILGQIF